MPAHCPSCGSGVAGDAVRCPHCGAVLGAGRREPAGLQLAVLVAAGVVLVALSLLAIYG
jgi:predicted nucleic acid-binding Zn ribbon protein